MTQSFDLKGPHPELKSAHSSCILKPMTLNHASNEYASWLNNKNINKYLESRYEKHTRSSIKNFIQSKINDDNSVFYAIHSLDGIHIGNIKLDMSIEHLRGDVGFIVGNPDYHGQGIATSAITLICSYGFSIGLKKITAGAYEDNIGSCKALKKSGFTEEGYFVKEVISNGNRIGTYRFGLWANN